jgi:alpha-D-ribose 1-methylphosphonate 5-phosphate C-P lyase
MKNIILIAAFLFAAKSVEAQAVHMDSSANMAYVNLQPIKYVFNKDTVRRLYVYSEFDNMGGQARIYYQLRSETRIDSVTYNYPVVMAGNYTIQGSDYTDWDKSDPSWIFNWVANSSRLNVNLID